MHHSAIRSLALALVAAAVAGPATPATPAAAGPSATCAGVPATLVGTDRRDRLVGTPGDDVIVGLGGDDLLSGRGGDDVICGGKGADDLVGGGGEDRLLGGGSRIVRGDGEVIHYRDVLAGGDGDDVLVPGEDDGNHDTRWDLLDYSGAPGGIVADVGSDTVTGHGTDVVVGDNYGIIGSRHDDEITGSDGEDDLYGGFGDDVVIGGLGDDTLGDSGYSYAPDDAADDVLDGGPGDDNLDAEDGNDRIYGRGGDDSVSSWGDAATHLHAGPGNDTVYANLVLSADQSVVAGLGRDEVLIDAAYEVDGDEVRPRTVIDLAAGTASVPAHGVGFAFSGAEVLMSYLPALTWYGTDGRDRVQADPTVDRSTARLVAYGRGGDDHIDGTTKADFIHGGRGRDVAHAEAGDDECVAVEVRRSC